MTSKNKMGINTEKMLGYDQKADIWSLGTLCYEMIIGKSAFDSKTMQELINKVQSGTYSVPTKLSKEIVSFLNAMLQFNSKKRLTCDEILNHPWLNGEDINNKHHLFTKVEMLMLSKTYIDYRKANMDKLIKLYKDSNK